MGVKLKLNEAATTKVVGSAVEKFMVGKVAPYVTRSVRDNIQAANRIDTGRMINSVELKAARALSRGGYRITVGSSLDYTVYQEFGTRDHGPVTAKFLRFKPKGAASYVFTKWVRGVTPMRAFAKTVQRFRIEDV